MYASEEPIYFSQESQRNNTGWLFSNVLLVAVMRADKLSAHSCAKSHMCYMLPHTSFTTSYELHFTDEETEV